MRNIMKVHSLWIEFALNMECKAGMYTSTADTAVDPG